MADAVRKLLDWIDIDSVTGGEGDSGDALARELAAEGFDVERQELSPGRFNVLARAGEPEVVFCTHLDTVPPWFGPERVGREVRGRGSCDAKGPALAMIEAARDLVASGERRIGFLFTVGEEVDGAGAQLADAKRAAPWSPRYTIVGEPTKNRFVKGHKGVFKARLCAKGVAGHSSRPLGPSAVHELVHSMHAMLEDSWGHHELFGDGLINFGLIEGGLAPNVVAPGAEASILVRAVEEPAVVEARLRSHVGGSVELQAYESYGPVEFVTPDCGETGDVVGFGTDAPFLGSWGKPLLYGPGDIDDAHTAHEKLDLGSFERAIGDYAAAARELLAQDA